MTPVRIVYMRHLSGEIEESFGEAPNIKVIQFGLR